MSSFFRGLLRYTGVSELNKKSPALICTPKSGHEKCPLFHFLLQLTKTSMAKRIFTKEVIAALKRNRSVLRVSERSITYHPDFKLATVKRYKEGISPSVIFREAGFDLAQIGKETPKYTLIRWRKKFDRTGVAGLAKDSRGSHGGGGRPPNLERMSEKDRSEE